MERIDKYDGMQLGFLFHVSQSIGSFPRGDHKYIRSYSGEEQLSVVWPISVYSKSIHTYDAVLPIIHTTWPVRHHSTTCEWIWFDDYLRIGGV